MSGCGVDVVASRLFLLRLALRSSITYRVVRNRPATSVLPRTPSVEHLALHWTMALAAYPFFAAVAESVGRLLRLQGALTRSEVHRRVAEAFGDRPTVKRATGVAVHNMTQWGGLEFDNKEETYRAQEPRAVGSGVAMLLLEGALRASGTDSAPLDTLLRSPALFPFGLPVLTVQELDESPGLRAMSLGGAEATLSLAR